MFEYSHKKKNNKKFEVTRFKRRIRLCLLARALLRFQWGFEQVPTVIYFLKTNVLR